MKILYGGRVFQMHKAGGVNRVFAEIISGLPADYYPLVTGVENFGKHVPGHPNLQQPGFKHFRPGHVTRCSTRSRHFGPQSLNVAIKQMTYGSGFRGEAPAGKG